MEDSNTLVPEPTSRYSSSLSSVPGSAHHKLLPVELALCLQISRCYCTRP